MYMYNCLITRIATNGIYDVIWDDMIMIKHIGNHPAYSWTKDGPISNPSAHIVQSFIIQITLEHIYDT